jgi:Fe-S-cluster containining protein
MANRPADPREMLTADLELRIGDRTLAVRLPVPAGPTTLRGMLPALRALMAGLTGVAIGLAAGEGREISCRARCGACCRQVVPLAGAEAHHLAALIDALPEPRRSIVVARFAAARAQLEAAGLWADLVHMARLDDPAATKALEFTYFAQRIACPFLDDESCSIYTERPLACREHLVSSDPGHCAEPGGQGVVPIRLGRRLSAAVARAGTVDAPHHVALIALFEWIAWNPEVPAARDAASILDEVLSYLTGADRSEP